MSGFGDLRLYYKSLSRISPQNIVSHHALVMLRFLTTFQILNILVKALFLILGVRYRILKLIGMYIKDMDFKGHPAVYFVLILRQDRLLPESDFFLSL